MSYHPNQRPSGLRYRDEGLELRCDYCPKGMCWWPLTEEFWSFRQSLRRCRACTRIAKNRRDQERRRRPEVRAASIAYQRRYRAEAKKVKALKAFDRYWSDPDHHRAKARTYYYANREAILERKRARHWARKAA